MQCEMVHRAITMKKPHPASLPGLSTPCIPRPILRIKRRLMPLPGIDGGRPNPAKSHRMALMGRPLDFNYEEMMERQKRLEADGFDRIRFFCYPDMAHQMPTSQCWPI